MKVVHSNFTFFKAGQGAFYGGTITSHDPTFRSWTIVYDCGTSPWINGNSESLNAEIDKFGAYPRSRKVIDLLFISHLDYDHVSGVIRLLREFQVKVIVIPYFPEEVRKFALTSFSSEDGGTDMDLSLEDYTRFVENPYQFLSSESDEEPRLYVISSEEQGDAVEYENYDNNNIDLHPIGILVPTKPEELNASNISYYKNGLQFFIHNKWEFVTYVKDVTTAQFTALKSCLNGLVKKTASNEITYEKIKIIVGNRTNRKKAHSCYKKCISDINAHGLVLLHGPRNFRHVEICNYLDDSLGVPRCSFKPYGIMHGHQFLSSKPFLGTLLMGDTSINDGTNPINFPPIFEQKLKGVHVFQVPHHGAAKNWDLKNYNNLNFGDNIGLNPINICNFGYGNTYGHPSHTVLSDLAGRIVLNSQFTRFVTKYHVFYKR